MHAVIGYREAVVDDDALRIVMSLATLDTGGCVSATAFVAGAVVAMPVQARRGRRRATIDRPTPTTSTSAAPTTSCVTGAPVAGMVGLTTCSVVVATPASIGRDTNAIHRAIEGG
jgi:hypothetical protein